MVVLQQKDGPQISITRLTCLQGRQCKYYFNEVISSRQNANFGTVEKWWPDSLHTSQPRAIKFLPLKSQIDKKYPIREVFWLSTLSHTHVVKFHEILLAGNYLGIVMDYHPAGSFRDLLNACKRQPFPEKVARWYFQQLMIILDFCHRKHGLTHRDLKPENLLLNEVPAWGPLKVLVLADFGMSKNEMDSVMVTWAGTKSYDAPEMRLKRPYDAKKADLWSSGVILFEMLHGHRPKGDTQNQSVQKAVPLSPELQDFLGKLLQPNPDERINLEEVKSHPWFVQHLQPGAFEGNDARFAQNVRSKQKHVAEAQNWQEARSILIQAFPGGVPEQIIGFDVAKPQASPARAPANWFQLDLRSIFKRQRTTSAASSSSVQYMSD